jgi:hypothetical protein
MAIWRGRCEGDQVIYDYNGHLLVSPSPRVTWPVPESGTTAGEGLANVCSINVSLYFLDKSQSKASKEFAC